MAELHEFLDELATNAGKLADFNDKTKTEQVMTNAGLSDGDKQLLRTGKDHEIQAELKKELRAKADTKANAYVIRMSPQP